MPGDKKSGPVGGRKPIIPVSPDQSAKKSELTGEDLRDAIAIVRLRNEQLKERMRLAGQPGASTKKKTQVSSRPLSPEELAAVTKIVRETKEGLAHHTLSENPQEKPSRKKTKPSEQKLSEKAEVGVNAEIVAATNSDPRNTEIKENKLPARETINTSGEDLIVPEINRDQPEIRREKVSANATPTNINKSEHFLVAIRNMKNEVQKNIGDNNQIETIKSALTIDPKDVSEVLFSEEKLLILKIDIIMEINKYIAERTDNDGNVTAEKAGGGGGKGFQSTTEDKVLKATRLRGKVLEATTKNDIENLVKYGKSVISGFFKPPPGKYGKCLDACAKHIEAYDASLQQSETKSSAQNHAANK